MIANATGLLGLTNHFFFVFSIAFDVRAREAYHYAARLAHLLLDRLDKSGGKQLFVSAHSSLVFSRRDLLKRSYRIGRGGRTPRLDQ